MLYPLSYQLYRYEHGRSAAEQRAADVRASKVAAALRDLRLSLGHAFSPGRMRSARQAAQAMTASVQVLSSGR